MRKSILITIVLSFLALAFPSTGDAAYRIRLKNGGEFKTLRYWNEGDQIKFYIYGGIVGIAKDSVRKIEKMAPGNILYGRSASYRKTAKISSKTNDHGDEKTKAEIDLSSYTDKKRQLDAELKSAKDRLREAIKDRDAEANQRERKTLKKIRNEIYVLTKEVRGMNEGKIPEGWWKKK
ncbi:hypothetical protein ES708_08099 [subsurface metagenome]